MINKCGQKPVAAENIWQSTESLIMLQNLTIRAKMARISMTYVRIYDIHDEFLWQASLPRYIFIWM
jgi:hypothetical protein